MSEQGDLSQAQFDQAPRKELGLRFSGKSVPSISHPERNEDAIGRSEIDGIAMVFDGVGGLALGDKASRLGREVVSLRLRPIPLNSDPESTKRAVSSALVEATSRIVAEVPNGGSTAVVAKFIESGGERRVIIGSVGDSRAYIFRNGNLIQITEDDSLVSMANLSLEQRKRIGEKLDQVATSEDLARLTPQEQAFFRRRNEITHLLGDQQINPHIYHVALKNGDVVMLTSDGVHDNLTTDEIRRITANSRGDIASDLVDAAKDRSGQAGQHLRAKPDDISAVIVQVTSTNQGKAVEQQPNRPPERQRVAPPPTIGTAQNFDQLRAAISSLPNGGLMGSREFYSTQELEARIAAVRRGEASINIITNTNGLRQIVERLLIQEKTNKNRR